MGGAGGASDSFIQQAVAQLWSGIACRWGGLSGGEGGLCNSVTNICLVMQGNPGLIF